MTTVTRRTRILTTSMAFLAAAASIAVTPRSGASQSGGAFGISSYQDPDGPAQIEIHDEGADPATGGDRIAVRLTQNGVTYPGSGFELVIAAPPVPDVGRTILIAFTVRSPTGQAYQFRGTVRAGGFVLPRIKGEGAYEPVGTGMDRRQWTLSGG